MSRTELTRHTPAALRVPLTWLAAPLTQNAEMGALPTLRAATDPGVLGGQYYGPDGPSRQRGYPAGHLQPRAPTTRRVQQRLWTVSEELTGVVFSVRTSATA